MFENHRKGCGICSLALYNAHQTTNEWVSHNPIVGTIVFYRFFDPYWETSLGVCFWGFLFCLNKGIAKPKSDGEKNTKNWGETGGKRYFGGFFFLLDFDTRDYFKGDKGLMFFFFWGGTPVVKQKNGRDVFVCLYKTRLFFNICWRDSRSLVGGGTGQPPSAAGGGHLPHKTCLGVCFVGKTTKKKTPQTKGDFSSITAQKHQTHTQKNPSTKTNTLQKTIFV